MPACYSASVALRAGTVWNWGAVEVRGHSGEMFFLTFLGVIWLIVSQHLFPWFGLCIADDIIERRNLAALIALSGATLAIATIYTAGNLGEGPSYWNNIFSAALGTTGFFALWFVLELVGRVSVSIAEERDLASGVRFGGFVLAVGLILSRAVAGDWHSESATVRDFIRDGWPAVALGVFAAFVERALRPSRARPFPGWLGCGLLPALAYLSCACWWVFHLGRWEGMPK
jgi:uncharacterized membrane protein YjfL (UPF0719 family)